MNEKIQKNDYNHFLQLLLTKIQQARYEMLMSASKQTLLLYWDIGKMVSEKMQNFGYGKSVVERLAKDLQTEIPGVRGFSARNIWNMKMFYDFYAQFGISATTVAELQSIVYEMVTCVGWTQNCIILEKCKDLNHVLFYLRQTKEKGWSKLDLQTIKYFLVK